MIPEPGFEKPTEIVGELRPRAEYLVMWNGALQGGSISICRGSFAGIWECPFWGGDWALDYDFVGLGHYFVLS